MSAPSLRLRFRPDLAAEQVRFGDRTAWIVRDPVAGRHFHFDPREYEILTTLDGEKSLQDVLDDVRRRRPEEHLPPETLVRFLAEARNAGLLSGGPTAAPGALDKPGRPAGSWMFARWPLFNPEPLLEAVTPALSFVFTKSFAAIYMSLIATAALSVVVRFDEFQSRLPELTAWLTPGMVAAIALALFGCKVVHELAHGVAARHFGARVEECGILFLFFLPCFYCDVSQAWMFRSRGQRILVSAGGMLAELGLAAVAAWLWWFSRPGPIQSLLVAVMATCSVNTLLINGNPLLRFDGYFILCDVLGMPNLASRASQWWARAFGRWVWGLPTADSEPGDWRAGAYGVLSAAYRVFVLSAILWLMHRVGREFGAPLVSLTLALLVLAGFASRMARMVAAPLGDPLLRRMLRRGRLGLSAIVVGTGLVVIAAVPWSRTIDADVVWEPDSATPVFAAAPGRLRTLSQAGSRIEAGQTLVVLENLQLQRELLEAETDQQLAAQRLDAARVRSNFDPEAARSIPALQEAADSATERQRLLAAEIARLTIAAPISGRVMPPPNVPERFEDSRTPGRWAGTPFDPENRDCDLERGALVAQIVPEDRLCAVACVHQRSIAKLSIGQSVRLARRSGGPLRLRGTIVEISPSPLEHAPRELVAAKRIPVRPGDGAADLPLEPHYRVRIRLDEGAGGGLLPGEIGVARVEVTPASLAGRAVEAVRDAFRFEL
ncbi:MAG: HlyD family efflux transporter periplasmic adaptor subunit [Planctomyces sp.]|nr:HlyD family efflux transporter periplasmic adaptor subunit [Planctomyces sp.]